jgi:HlyD family secretion protein
VRYALAAAGIIAVSVAAYFVYGNRPISVQTASVEHDVPVRVFGLGTVEARVLSKIGFDVGATLVELNADHGDGVSKGDVLARLNPGEQEARVAKARAALISAEANTTRADANLEKARAVLAQKQGANQRKQALASGNVISEEAAEEAQREEDVAKADVSVAMSEIDIARQCSPMPALSSSSRKPCCAIGRSSLLTMRL